MLATKILKNSEYDLLYYVGYIIFLIVSIFNTSLYSIYTVKTNSIIYIFIILIFFIRELIGEKQSVIHYIIISLGLLCAMLVGVSAQSTMMTMTIIMVTLLGKTNLRTVMKLTIIVTWISVLFIVLSSKVGIIDDIVFKQGDRIRHAFGFRYVLFLPTYLFNLVAISIYLRRENISYLSIFFYSLLNILLFIYSNARLCVLTTGLLLLYIIVYKLKHYHKRNYYNQSSKHNKLLTLFIPIYPVIGFFSLYAIVYYNDHIKWMKILNELIGNRLLIGNRSYNIYHFSLLGNSNISWVGQGINISGEKIYDVVTYVDNVYFNFLQKYGILVFGFLLFFLTYMMYRCYLENDKILMMIMIVLAVHGFIDDLIQHIQYNTFLFFIIPLCFKRTTNKIITNNVVNLKKNEKFF